MSEFFCMCMSGCSSTICLRDHPCSMVLLSFFRQKSVEDIHGSLFWSSLLWFGDLFVYSFTNTTLLWLLHLYRKFWSWSVSAFQLCHSLSILPWLSWMFCLYISCLELVCRYPQHNFLGFWLKLQWMYRSNWKKLRPW